MAMQKNTENWDLILRPRSGWWEIDLSGIWRYRSLVLLLVKRDFAALYKQTILGPVWFLINPLFSTGVMTLVFSNIAQISTDGIPPFLFYMSGSLCWGYFSNCLTKSSNTFLDFRSIFSKVYFPRLIVPISYLAINLYQFAIQFLLFLALYLFFALKGMPVKVGFSLLIAPVLVFQMAILGLGIGVLVTAFTTRYRDVVYLIGFSIGIWSYVTPIVYPASIVPAEYFTLYMLNPMAVIVEQFRFIFFYTPPVAPVFIIFSWVFTLAMLSIGVIMFYRVEKNFVDTV